MWYKFAATEIFRTPYLINKVIKKYLDYKFSASDFSDIYDFKNTHRGNKSSNKSETLTKSVNINIWAVDTLTQLFKRGSDTQIDFSKKIRQLMSQLGSLW